MNTCTICGASMHEDEQACPTCGGSTSGDPYAPGEALVAEVEPLPIPLAPAQEDYGVKMQLEAVLTKAFNLWTGALGRLVATQVPWMACFVPFIGIVAAMALADPLGSKSPSMGLIVGMVISLLLMVPAVIATQAATLLILEDRARGHEPGLSAMAAFRLGLRFVGRLLLAGIAIGTIVILSFVPATVLLSYQQWTAGLLAFIPPFVVLFYLWIWIIPLSSVLVVEDKPLNSALRRTAQLLRGCKWKVLGYALMGWLVIATLAGAVGFIGLIPIFGQIVSLAMNLFLAPLWSAIFFSLYAALSDRERAATRSL